MRTNSARTNRGMSRATSSIQEQDESTSNNTSTTNSDDNNTSSNTSDADDSSTSTTCSSAVTEEESDWSLLRRIFSAGWSSVPNILFGDLSYVPSVRTMQRLDKLEDFSEQRHYHTKFGTRFVDSDYVQSMNREVVLFTKAIREDIEDGDAAAKAAPPKTKLDKIYEIYSNNFKAKEGTTVGDLKTSSHDHPINDENKNPNETPSKVVQKRLDNLESSSELRHFNTKFGTPFIDDTIIQTTREEVFFTKMISGDVKEMILAEAKPSELDIKYKQYLQSKMNNTTPNEEASFSIFSNKANAPTDAFSLGSDWTQTTIDTEEQENESFRSLRSDDWTVAKKSPNKNTLITAKNGYRNSKRTQRNLR